MTGRGFELSISTCLSVLGLHLPSGSLYNLSQIFPPAWSHVNKRVFVSVCVKSTFVDFVSDTHDVLQPTWCGNRERYVYETVLWSPQNYTGLWSCLGACSFGRRTFGYDILCRFSVRMCVRKKRNIRPQSFVTRVMSTFKNSKSRLFAIQIANKIKTSNSILGWFTCIATSERHTWHFIGPRRRSAGIVLLAWTWDLAMGFSWDMCQMKTDIKLGVSFHFSQYCATDAEQSEIPESGYNEE